MSTADRAKLLHALLGKLRGKITLPKPVALAAQAASAATTPDGAIVEVKPENGAGSGHGCCFHTDPVLREFVRSFLIWESTVSRAEAAIDRLCEACVDVNEFRVCLPDEMAQIIGTSYPKIEDRVHRLRSALGDIYKREHRMRLAHLLDKSKREARAYLDTLAGVPKFVAARVSLLCLDSHAFPVDQRILGKFTEAGIIDEQADADAAAGWLERTLKAGEAAQAYQLIQAWADGAGASRPKTAKKKPAAKKATKAAPPQRKKARAS